MAIARTQMRTQLTGDRMPAKSEKQRRYMAAAYNKLYIATADGNLLCMGK